MSGRFCLFFNFATSNRGTGMEIQGGNASGTSGATLGIKSLQMAKNQQEIEGQATLQLLESAADVPKAASSGSLGSSVDTFA
jgi:hypothetical protein